MLKKSSNSVKVFYPRYDKERIIQVITERIKKLNGEISLRLVVLFGSYSKGNYTVGSDIDILIIYKEEKEKDAYVITKRIFDIPHLEPHVYTEREYEERKETINRMIKDGIVFFPSL
ncbi:MAG: nucleotidyltransferase domain-containing protein [bacterium]|nr:nucleotidyltransferase domain-containing protein [bacterium]